MAKWIVKGWDPINKKHWYIAKFDSKFKAKMYIRRNKGLHMGNLHKGEQ